MWFALSASPPDTPWNGQDSDQPALVSHTAHATQSHHVINILTLSHKLQQNISTWNCKSNFGESNVKPKLINIINHIFCLLWNWRERADGYFEFPCTAPFTSVSVCIFDLCYWINSHLRHSLLHRRIHRRILLQTQQHIPIKFDGPPLFSHLQRLPPPFLQHHPGYPFRRQRPFCLPWRRQRHRLSWLRHCCCERDHSPLPEPNWVYYLVWCVYVALHQRLLQRHSPGNVLDGWKEHLFLGPRQVRSVVVHHVK